jgi:hypothetical protein
MQETGGMYYATKCDTMVDGLIEHESEGNPGGWGKEANQTLSCNPGNVRRNGELGGEGQCEGKCGGRTDDGQYQVA